MFTPLFMFICWKWGMGMLKRKYGHRPEWKRIIHKEYAQTFLNTKEFKGYVALLHTVKVREPLFICYGEKNVCIVDDGYMWLQQFLTEKNHSVTTMFDGKGNIVQWYIDVCLTSGMALLGWMIYI